jgi:hypothetical protein
VQLSRRLAIERYLPAVLIGGVGSADQWRAAFGTMWGSFCWECRSVGGLLKERVELPPQVHLLSLECMHGTEHGLIIHLQHIYEKGEDPSLAKPVALNLLHMFSADLGIEAVIEMTVTEMTVTEMTVTEMTVTEMTVTEMTVTEMTVIEMTVTEMTVTEMTVIEMMLSALLPKSNA